MWWSYHVTVSNEYCFFLWCIGSMKAILLACVYEGQVVGTLHLLYCRIITRTSHCLHAWPTLIHGNSGHVAVRAGARERCLMNRSLDARSWSACSWLLYCSMQRVMFRPCTHLSDHDTWSNQKVTWSNTCPSRDWPYVMSRQNNQTERDQLMVNSLLYEWCTFPWL